MQKRKRRKGALFELGGYWIATVPGTENLYRFWVESGSRTVRRRSMGTPDLEQAKEELARIVLGQAPTEPLSPDAVTIATVLEHYWQTHSDATRGEYQARRAGELLVEWLVDERNAPGAQVGQFTRLWQEEFMRWCATAKGHSVATISRTMSILAAAVNHAVKPVMVEDEAGRREAQVLKYAVPVVYRADAVSVITGKPEPSPRDWLPNWDEMARFIDGIGRRTASGTWDENRENLFRYVVLALNTWARPEAILGLNLRSQINHEAGIVHLNPAGRRQTKKHRPAICLKRNLALWLESEEWKDLTYAVHRKSVPLTTITQARDAGFHAVHAAPLHGDQCPPGRGRRGFTRAAPGVAWPQAPGHDILVRAPRS